MSRTSSVLGSNANRGLGPGWQIQICLFLAVSCFLDDWHEWDKWGGGRPKSALYGIWNVEQVSLDGQPHPLLAIDATAFKRAIFDRTDSVTFQQMDESFVDYQASVNPKHGTLALSKYDDKKWHASLHYQRPAPNQLILNGSWAVHLSTCNGSCSTATALCC